MPTRIYLFENRFYSFNQLSSSVLPRMKLMMAQLRVL